MHLAESEVKEAVSRLDGQSGVKKELSDPFRAKLENYFQRSMDSLEFRESDDVDEIGASAYAKGNEIHFKPGMFQQDTALGQKMIAHEISHIRQQSGGYIPTIGGLSFDTSSESAADRDGDAVASMKDPQNWGSYSSPGRISGEVNSSVYSPMEIASGSNAVVQGWGIGGLLSWLNSHAFTRHSKKRGVNSNATLEGVHELLTRKAAEKTGKVLKGTEYEGILKSKKAKKSLKAGARWNDVYHNSNLGFALKYTRHSDEFINQSHHGDLQFLHSMDTTGGNTAENIRKMRRWAMFANDVYQNKEVEKGKQFRDQNMLDYVLKMGEDPNDPFFIMMASTMISKERLSALEKFAKEESRGDDKLYQKMRMEGIKYELRDMAKLMHKRIRDRDEEKALNRGLSSYARKSIGDFFTNGNKSLDAGFVALGSASHLLEDSFAGSHAIREFNVKYTRELGGMDIGEGQNDAISDNITPILLNADYNAQDETRHAYADLMLNGRKLNDTDIAAGFDSTDASIANTQGAAQSRDVAAQFMYNAITGSDSQRNFIENVTKASDTGGKSISKAGNQYERDAKDYESEKGNTYSFSEGAKKLISAHNAFKLEKLGYNYNDTAEVRLNKYHDIMQNLSEILANESVGVPERQAMKQHYETSVNETEIMVNSILNQLENAKQEDILKGKAVKAIITKIRKM